MTLAEGSESRWRRAWRDTRGLKDWRRNFAGSLLVGACSVLALLIVGPDETGPAEAVVVGAGLVAGFLVRPLLEFVWNLLWTPWRQLNEAVLETRGAVRDLSTRLGESQAKRPDAAKRRQEQFKVLSQRLGILRGLENEVRPALKSARGSLGTGLAVGFRWEANFWTGASSGVAALADWQDFYERVRDEYEELDRLKLNYLVSGGGTNGRISGAP